MNNPEFELVQVHENGDYAEIVVRDKNNFKVYAGNLDIVSNPKSYYPPNYMDKNDCFYDCEFCGCNTNAKIRACCKKGREADIEKKGKNNMIKLEYFGEKENQPGPCEIFIKIEYSNGASVNEKLKHILRHSPDGFNMGYAGSGCSDLALSILTDFCERKNINNDIVEKLYQKFKFDFIVNCSNKLLIKCIEIAEWLIKKEPELKNKLFEGV